MNEFERRFWTILKDQFAQRFVNDPKYAVVAEKNLPGDYAFKFMTALKNGTADKDGAAVKSTCKALGIKCTYKAIAAYLATGSK